MDVFSAGPRGKIVANGEFAGSITEDALPSVPCTLATVKARSDNSGSVFIGKTGVTVANGSTDTTTGYELAPGEPFPGWFIVDNLNELSRICDNAGDDLTYICMDG